MIIEALCNLVKTLLLGLFGLVPDLPAAPDRMVETIDNVLDLIFNEGVTLLSLFINIDTLLIICPIAILVYNADKIIAIILWIVRKLPININ